MKSQIYNTIVVYGSECQNLLLKEINFFFIFYDIGSRDLAQGEEKNLEK